MNLVNAVTLDRLGYRKAAGSGTKRAEVVGKLTQRGFFETQLTQDYLWLRVRDRARATARKPTISISLQITSASAFHESDL
jgi:hypothetical protein